MKKLISIGFALFFSGCHPVPAQPLQINEVCDTHLCAEKGSVIIVTEEELRLVLTESEYTDLIMQDDGVDYEDLRIDEMEGLEFEVY